MLFNAAGVSAQMFVCGDEVATPPEFPGGKQALNEFIQSHLVYPNAAIVNRIEGNVIVGFVITEEGKVADVQIQKPLFRACDSTVLQLIQSMPEWIPAKPQDEKTMFCRGSLSISFDLSAYRKMNGKNCECLDNLKQTMNDNYEKISRDVNSQNTLPSFPGGDEKLLQYLAKNISFPTSEYGKEIDDQVELLFVVAPTGKIACIEVLKSLGKAFDDAAIKCIKSMPAWTPGTYNGEAIYTFLSMPVRFKSNSSALGIVNVFKYSVPRFML
jgi:TonB family protein